MRVVYWQSQLFLVPLRGKHVVLSIGFANCSLAKPRDAHTAPLGAGGSSRIEYLVFFVNILPRRGPKGRAHTAPLGAGKDPDSTPSAFRLFCLKATILSDKKARYSIGGSFQPSGHILPKGLDKEADVRPFGERRLPQRGWCPALRGSTNPFRQRSPKVGASWLRQENGALWAIYARRAESKGLFIFKQSPFVGVVAPSGQEQYMPEGAPKGQPPRGGLNQLPRRGALRPQRGPKGGGGQRSYELGNPLGGKVAP